MNPGPNSAFDFAECSRPRGPRRMPATRLPMLERAGLVKHWLAYDKTKLYQTHMGQPGGPLRSGRWRVPTALFGLVACESAWIPRLEIEAPTI